MPRTETTPAEQEAQGLNHFDGVLAGLADGMREYDELIDAKRLLAGDLGEHRRITDTINPGLAVSEQPEEVAVAALRACIAERELAPIQAKIDNIKKFSMVQDNIGALIGRTVHVESTDPERYSLGTVRLNRYGYYDGSSQWLLAQRGKIVEASLSPVYGGHLILKGRWGRFYSTCGLIDRYADYKPAFKITEL